jgi:aryl-alcohol dehydrogenase-like predicted oxidoreductase
MVHTALECGITLFDTAEGYGRGLAEEHLGYALKELGRPDGITVVTKTGPLFDEERADGRSCNLGAAHLHARVEGSLRRLGVDRIDVLLAHAPDSSTPIAETMHAAETLKQAGKIAHFGVSNFNASLLEDAARYGPVLCNQLPCSLADRQIEDGRRETCLALGIGIMAYSPLGKGILTGKYDAVHLPPSEDYRHQKLQFRENLDSNLQIAARLRELATRFDTTPAALALAWTLQLPGITVALPGAKNSDQIREHALAVELLDHPGILSELADL